MMASSVHFIVGPHRSGTTYLQSLLGTLPNVGTTPETHFFCRILPYLKTLEASQNRSISFADIKHAIITIMFLGDDRITFWDELEESYGMGGYRKLFLCLLSNLSQQIKAGVSTLIEKTPSHLLCIDEIKKIFPDAKYVVMVRDPRAIATSFLKYLPDLSQRQRYSYLACETAYIQQFFCIINEIVNRSLQNIAVVRYEDLREDRVAVLKRLSDFLDIEFFESNLNRYREVASQILLAGDVHKYSNVQGQNPAFCRSWDDLLTVRERLFIEIRLQNIFRLFRYPHRYNRHVCKLIKPIINAWARNLPPWKMPGTSKDRLIDAFTPWSPSISAVSHKDAVAENLNSN